MSTMNVVLFLVAGISALLNGTEASWANVGFTSSSSDHRRSHVSGRIVGGWEPAPGQLPYMAGIFMDDTYFCGGALVADSYVLTSGDCLFGIVNFEVHLGAHNIYDDEEEPNHVVLKVTSDDVTLHPDYNPANIDGDLGLLRLHQPVTGPGKFPIRLPSRSQAGDMMLGEEVVVAGWGDTLGVHAGKSKPPKMNSVLRAAELKVQDNASCKPLWSDDFVWDRTVCASRSRIAICNEDQGGPVTLVEADGLATLVGVVSFVTFNCEVGNPFGVVRLNAFLDWVEANAGVTIRP